MKEDEARGIESGAEHIPTPEEVADVFEQLVGGEDIEGALVESVQTVHETAAIDVPPELIETPQQRLAIRQPV